MMYLKLNPAYTMALVSDISGIDSKPAYAIALQSGMYFILLKLAALVNQEHD